MSDGKGRHLATPVGTGESPADASAPDASAPDAPTADEQRPGPPAARPAAAGLEQAASPHEDGDDPLEALSDEDMAGGGIALLHNPRRLAGAALAILLLVVAIYVLFPKVVGIEDTLQRVDDATWYWILVAVGFNFLGFAAYVALFRGVLGGTGEDEIQRRLDMRASYQITMAGLAATRLFSAGGAGGIAVSYWALRKAGMERRRAACRMVAFLVLLYTVYLAALLVFGILLRSDVLPGDDPVGGTIVPAAVAGSVLVILLLVALIPQDVERRLASFNDRHGRSGRLSRRLVRVPATVASGVRTAIAYVRHPSRGALAVGGALGFWGANIAVLWASFEAFGGDVPVGVLVQGFFVGMAANLIPSPAGGVGSVDAGMIAAFVLFGVASSIVFPAVLAYRLIAFWLPIPPGVVAYFQLRRTTAEWDRQAAPRYTSESKVATEVR